MAFPHRFKVRLTRENCREAPDGVAWKSCRGNRRWLTYARLDENRRPGPGGLLASERNLAAQPLNHACALADPHDKIEITRLELIPVNSPRSIFVKVQPVDFKNVCLWCREGGSNPHAPKGGGF